MASSSIYSAVNGRRTAEDGADNLDQGTATPRTSVDQFIANPSVSQPKSVPEETKRDRSNTDKATKQATVHDWNGSWVWEIGAASLSVIGLGLLIGFLAKIHGTPYANWQYTASPNTVVSIIVTITKASLLVPVSACLSQLKWNQYRDPKPIYSMQAIDQASRGPWGALEVLWIGIPGLSIDTLTLLGALITILALAIDPFAQQILAFPSHNVQAFNETASIEAAHKCYFPQQEYVGREFDGTLAPSMLSSIISGLAQANRPLEPKCSSGNCKFPQFITMGICSRCEDVTSHADQTCRTSDEMTSLNSEGPFKILGTAHVNCTYNLPNGIEIHADESGSGSYPNVTTVSLNYWSIRPLNRTTIMDIERPIFSFLAANQSLQVTYVPENMTTFPPKPLFTECSFFYCEQEHSPSHYLVGNSASDSPNVSNTQALIPKDSSKAISENAGDAIHFRPPTDTAFLSTNASYIMDYYTFNSLSTVLRGVFNTTLDSAYQGGGSSGLMEPILRSTDLEQLLQSMSTSMTDTIRANSRADKILGKEFRDESLIKVRWPWIVLPICIILGSLALLVGTASASKKQQAILWKSSVIPLIMSHVETCSDQDLVSERNVDELHRISKNIDVEIYQDGMPLRFRERERFS